MSETQKRATVIQGFTLRLGIALLTFIVGISAVGLWLYRRSTVNSSRPAQGWQSAVEKQPAEETARTKWIYLTTSHTVLHSDIIVLYSDGEWLQTDVEVERKRGKLELSFFNNYDILAGGTWRQDINGEVIATVDKCFSSAESIPLDGGHQAKYPVVIHWLFTNGAPGQEGSILHTAHEELRLLSTNQLATDGNDALLDAYRAFRNKSQYGGRICLREDLDIFLK